MRVFPSGHPRTTEREEGAKPVFAQEEPSPNHRGDIGGEEHVRDQRIADARVGSNGTAEITGQKDGPDDEKGFCTRCDRLGQRRIGRLKGIIFLASEEPQERTTFLRDMIADRAAQHRILRLEGVEHRPLRDRTFHVDLHFGADARQCAQVSGKHDADHGSVWTSTESTPGRCCTMGVQLSPASADAYTCPPVVPKYTPHLSRESTAMASRNTFT